VRKLQAPLPRSPAPLFHSMMSLVSYDPVPCLYPTDSFPSPPCEVDYVAEISFLSSKTERLHSDSPSCKLSNHVTHGPLQSLRSGRSRPI
jgi:hypothetical protein